MTKKRIILASASPRRKELMELAGFEFEIQVSQKEEVYHSTRPDEIVKELENEGIIISVMGDFPGMEEIFDCPIYGNHNLNVFRKA